MSELKPWKPCPFCGCERGPGLDLAPLKDYVRHVWQFKDGTLCPMSGYHPIAAWNRRADTQPDLHEELENEVICCCGDHLKPTGPLPDPPSESS